MGIFSSISNMIARVTPSDLKETNNLLPQRPSFGRPIGVLDGELQRVLFLTFKSKMAPRQDESENAKQRLLEVGMEVAIGLNYSHRLQEGECIMIAADFEVVALDLSFIDSQKVFFPVISPEDPRIN